MAPKLVRTFDVRVPGFDAHRLKIPGTLGTPPHAPRSSSSHRAARQTTDDDARDGVRAMWGDDDRGVVADGALTAEAHEVVTRVEVARRASL